MMHTTCKGAHWIERSNRWPVFAQQISIGVVKGIRARLLFFRLCERRQFTADRQECDRSENSEHCLLMLLRMTISSISRPLKMSSAVMPSLDRKCAVPSYPDLQERQFVTRA